MSTLSDLLAKMKEWGQANIPETLGPTLPAVASFVPNAADMKVDPANQLWRGVGEALGLWPTQAQVEQQVQSQAGLTPEAASWLGDNTRFSVASPTGKTPYRWMTGGAMPGPVLPGLLNFLPNILGLPGPGTIALSTPDPLTYAHEGLHQWWPKRTSEDPTFGPRFGQETKRLESYQPGWPSPENSWITDWDSRLASQFNVRHPIWDRFLGRDPYAGRLDELYAYIGESGSYDPSLIAPSLWPFYQDYYQR